MSMVMRCNHRREWFFSMLLFVVIFNIACVNAGVQSSGNDYVINKSTLDTREYRYFKLDNEQ